MKYPPCFINFFLENIGNHISKFFEQSKKNNLKMSEDKKLCEGGWDGNVNCNRMNALLQSILKFG